MLSSSSSITPRSQTEWAGEMLSLLTVTERLHVVSFDRFACEPNHIASVLTEFSCNRRDAHQAAMSLAHSDNLRRMLSTSLTRPLAYACLRTDETGLCDAYVTRSGCYWCMRWTAGDQGRCLVVHCNQECSQLLCHHHNGMAFVRLERYVSKQVWAVPVMLKCRLRIERSI